MAITIDGLADAVMEQMRSYRDEITEDVRASVMASANACVAELKVTSPKLHGNYRRSWRLTRVFEKRTGILCRVHNKDYYQLTHLLEDGHAKVSGGRVPGKPHIQPAADNAAKLLQKDVEMRVGKK